MSPIEDGNMAPVGLEPSACAREVLVVGLQPAARRGPDDSFDFEAAIDDLLFDKGCQSLELPSFLTPEQRKCARQVADQHVELKCESYGFGSDRRLHIFKKSAITCVRVKNTFVDGWEAEDGGDKDLPERIVFQSAPANLASLLQSICPRMNAGDGKLELPPLCSSKPSRPPSRPVTPASDLEHPAFPPGTFNEIALGTQVVIKGLVKSPDFNGRVGVLHSIDPETGRYDVLLASPSCQRQWAKVKFENLRIAQCSNDHATSAAA